jgi:hypothetical protein
MDRRHSNAAHSNGRARTGGLPPFSGGEAMDQRSVAGVIAALARRRIYAPSLRAKAAPAGHPGGGPRSDRWAKSQRRFCILRDEKTETFPSRLGVGVRG